MEVTHESWCSRLSNGIHGMVFGFFLFFASMALLGWNEGAYVHKKYDINDARTNGVEVDCTDLKSGAPASVLPKNSLIHFTCPLNLTQAVVADKAFPMVSIRNQLFLTRASSMCQWSTTTSTKKDSVGGGKTTVCKYDSMDFRSTFNDYSSGSCSGAAVSSKARQGYSSYFGPTTEYATGVTVSTVDEVRRRRLAAPAAATDTADATGTAVAPTSALTLGKWSGVDISVPPSLLAELRGKSGKDCVSESTCGAAGSACASYEFFSAGPFVANGYSFVVNSDEKKVGSR